jgi:hypothetical protein
MVNAESRDTYWRISHRVTTLVAVAVAAVSTAALAVVASQHGASALATVVLALALMSFVIQILVFLLQLAESNRQAVRDQELYGRMLGVLAQIEEHTAGTQEVLSGHFATVLEAALGKALPQAARAESGSVDRRELATTVAGLVSEDLRRSSRPLERNTPESSTEGVFRLKEPDPHDPEIVRLLTTFPESEAEVRDALTTLRELTPPERGWLLQLANDEIIARHPGARWGPGLLGRQFERPMDLGLVTDISSPSGGRLYVLTPKGRQVARLLSASSGIPPNLDEETREALRSELPANAPFATAFNERAGGGSGNGESADDAE